jgi:hypothetical protein
VLKAFVRRLLAAGVAAGEARTAHGNFLLLLLLDVGVTVLGGTVWVVVVAVSAVVVVAMVAMSVVVVAMVAMSVAMSGDGGILNRIRDPWM